MQIVITKSRARKDLPLLSPDVVSNGRDSICSSYHIFYLHLIPICTSSITTVSHNQWLCASSDTAPYIFTAHEYSGDSRCFSVI